MALLAFRQTLFPFLELAVHDLGDDLVGCAGVTEDIHRHQHHIDAFEVQVGQDLRLCLPLATFLTEKLEDFSRQLAGLLIQLEAASEEATFFEFADFANLLRYFHRVLSYFGNGLSHNFPFTVRISFGTMSWTVLLRRVRYSRHASAISRVLPSPIAGEPQKSWQSAIQPRPLLVRLSVMFIFFDVFVDTHVEPSGLHRVPWRLETDNRCVDTRDRWYFGFYVSLDADVLDAVPTMKELFDVLATNGIGRVDIPLRKFLDLVAKTVVDQPHGAGVTGLLGVLCVVDWLSFGFSIGVMRIGEVMIETGPVR